MKVKSIDDYGIYFDNGDSIGWYHYQDCCETNWPDFRQLKDTGIFNEKFTTPLIFEKCNYGFRFGNEGKMYYVPCYTDQNGYYSNEVEITYFDHNTNELSYVLEDVDCEDESYYEWDTKNNFVKVN